MNKLTFYNFHIIKSYQHKKEETMSKDAFAKEAAWLFEKNNLFFVDLKSGDYL